MKTYHSSWNEILDKYLTTETITPEEYYSLELEEQRIIQEIKKAFKRIKSNDKKLFNFQEQ